MHCRIIICLRPGMSQICARNLKNIILSGTNVGEAVFDACLDQFANFCDLCAGGDEGRGEKHMIAINAI